jgi:hypothetical protein
MMRTVLRSAIQNARTTSASSTGAAYQTLAHRVKLVTRDERNQITSLSEG